ncbi:hypothetical protein ACFQ07_04035, partial [Actinomadura adrarensis]
LLAAAGDDEYRDAVEGLAFHRRSSAQRLNVAYLAPTRHDWVEECCTDHALRGRSRHHAWKLQCSLGTSRHVNLYLRHIGHQQLPYYDDFVFPTIVDGLGADAFPLLKACLERRHHVDGGKHLCRGLALLPTDEAFGVLLERVGDRSIQPVVAEALDRFPARGLRMLAPLA